MISVPICINGTPIANVEIVRSGINVYDPEDDARYTYTVISNHTAEPKTGSVAHNPKHGALKLVYDVLGDFLKET